jgi:hypothetical protein
MKPQPSYSKYRAIRTEVDGISFASKREAKRYSELKMLERAKVIKDLQLQVRYPLEVNGVKITTYIGDFSYLENDKFIVEDAKGFYRTKDPITRLYDVKKRLMLALHGIEIRET